MAATTTDAPLSDEDLAARAARRESGGRVPRAAEDAFEQLDKRHARPLIAFLAASARRGERDDLHQEVWQRDWRHLPGGFRGGNFRAWLFEIARHVLIDHARTRRPEPLDDPEHRRDDRAGAPDACLIERERTEALRRCLERLSSEAAALVRARLGGEDDREACRRLDLTPERAYKLFHLAKERLQACLEHALA